MRKKLMIFLWIVVIAIFVFIGGGLFRRFAPQFGGKPSIIELEKLSLNSRYENARFRNLDDKPVILPKSYGKIIRQQLKKIQGRIPAAELPSVAPVFKDTNSILSVIWLGHSTVLIRMGNTLILTDPVFSQRVSPVSFAGPVSFKYSVTFNPLSIPVPDVILISHDHFDHLDYRTIKKYYKGVKQFIVPLGIKSHLVKWGVPGENIQEADWWESKWYDKIEFVATPSQHFSGRRGQDNSTLWCSWVVRGGEKKIFYCGDSGYGQHFKEIGRKSGPFDLTFIESGAYGDYWPFIHMKPEESVQAHIDLGGKILLPIHWAKYNLALHPWKEPVERLLSEASKRKVTFTTPLPGEEVLPDKILPQQSWWRSVE